MASPKSSRPASAALLALLPAACGDEDAGLSRADVEKMVRAEVADAAVTPDAAVAPESLSADVEEAVRRAIAEMPQPEAGLPRTEIEQIVRAAVAAAPAPQPGLTSAQMEEAIAAALTAMPQPEPGPTPAEAEQIARRVVASVPSRSAPAEYTRFVVESAISHYEATGRDATVAYYNRPDSVDGQWYVFIVDPDDRVIGHYDPDRRGLDLNGWVGTDVNGYNFGPEMLSATADGKWVSYVYRNPETADAGSEDFGDLQLKNAWVVRHDGMLFGSGWYIDADELTKSLVAVAVDKFSSAGLQATIEYFASPQSAAAGLRTAIDYYNNADSIEGKWTAFIADTDGRIVAHDDPEMLGTDLEDLLGAAASAATAHGSWVTTSDIDPSTHNLESMRVWMVNHDGTTFGSGWYNDESYN